mgnify:CR=1 FL=1
MQDRDQSPEAIARAALEKPVDERDEFLSGFLWTSLDEAKGDVVRRLAFGEVVPASREHSQNELLSDGYVRQREGRVQLFSDAFASFIRSECDSTPPPSLWSNSLCRIVTSRSGPAFGCSRSGYCEGT